MATEAVDKAVETIENGLHGIDEYKLVKLDDENWLFYNGDLSIGQLVGYFDSIRVEDRMLMGEDEVAGLLKKYCCELSDDLEPGYNMSFIGNPDEGKIHLFCNGYISKSDRDLLKSCIE